LDETFSMVVFWARVVRLSLAAVAIDHDLSMNSASVIAWQYFARSLTARVIRGERGTYANPNAMLMFVGTSRRVPGGTWWAQPIPLVAAMTHQ